MRALHGYLGQLQHALTDLGGLAQTGPIAHQLEDLVGLAHAHPGLFLDERFVDFERDGAAVGEGEPVTVIVQPVGGGLDLYTP